MTRIRSRDASRIQDRRGGGGGGFGIPMGGGGFPIPMRTGGGILGLLVVLAIVFLPRLLGGGGGGGDEDSGGTNAKACTTEMEQIVCGATNDVHAYWVDALPAAYGQQYQATDTAFFSGFTSTGCGQASAQTGPFYCPADALVYFDLDFLEQLQQQFGATGDLAAQYIVAHEYGHHVQNLLGTNQLVQQAPASQQNEYSIALELQADCYAGTWAHTVGERDLFDRPDEVEEALNAAAAVGDDRIQQQTQGRVDPETWTHGSSEQRMQWFRTGYETGDPRQCDATFAGLR